jgi:O-antigen/teichoic acid export membrane protein
VFFSLFNDGNRAILQGMQCLKEIAISGFIPAGIGLIISFPLYYYYGTIAIVPCLILIPFISSIVSLVFIKRNIPHKTIYIKLADIIQLSIDFIKLGIVMVFAALLGNVTLYLINAFIARTGNIADVGLYQAGTGITNQYIGLVFTAMAVDYFPRLSSVAHNKSELTKMVNQQSEITILLTLPLLAIMIISAPLLINILLSSEFYIIKNFIRIIAFAMLFKSMSYPLGYITFAKGDKKAFFFLEGVLGNCLNLFLCVIGYYSMGLKGLAISFFINYLLYFIIVCIVMRKLYDFKINSSVKKIIIISICSLSFVFLLVQNQNLTAFIIAIIGTLLICLYSLHEINERIDIKKILTSRRMKRG